MAIKWEGKGFMESLPRIYAIYTGGFLAFFALMAILEQFGLSARAIGILFVLFTLVVYAFIGVISRTTAVDAYYVAGRSVPPVFNGMATAADWMSGASFVAMAGGIFMSGHPYMAFIVGWTGGYILIATLMAPYLRKFACYTGPDFIGTRYRGHEAVHARLVLGELRRGGIDVALDHGHGREEEYKPASPPPLAHGSRRDGHGGQPGSRGRNALGLASALQPAPGMLAALLLLQALVLEGFTLIDGTGAPPRPDAALVIVDGRIAAVGPRGEIDLPADARVLDLAGRTVIPGLIDAHAHVAFLRHAASVSPEYDPATTRRVLRLLLRFGITGARNPMAPAAVGAALRDAVAAGAIEGPRLRTAGDWVDARAFPTPQRVRDEVTRQAALGVDDVKLYAGLPPGLVKAGIEAAHEHGLKVIGHVQATSWSEAADLGIDFLTHASRGRRPWLQKGCWLLFPRMRFTLF